MSLRTMSFDAIENLHRLDHNLGETIQEMIPVVSGWRGMGNQAGAARSAISDIGRDNFDLGRNMTYDTWHHGGGHKPHSETGILREVDPEHKCPLGLIAALVPSGLHAGAQ